jgi:hypothetical protein
LSIEAPGGGCCKLPLLTLAPLLLLLPLLEALLPELLLLPLLEALLPELLLLPLLVAEDKGGVPSLKTAKASDLGRKATCGDSIFVHIPLFTYLSFILSRDGSRT